jgi:signal transduction histidine kinase
MRDIAGRVAIGLGCSLVTSVIVVALYRFVGTPFPLLFVFSAFVAALRGGRVGGFAAILGALTPVWYFTDPVGWATSLSGAISIAMFLVAAVIIVESIARMSEAVAAREALLAVVSHDLKTPVAALSLLEQRQLRPLTRESASPSREELQRHGEAVLRVVDRLVFMIDNLLDVGRLQANRMQYTATDADFAQLVLDSVSRIRPELEASGISVQTTGVEQPCPGRCDVLAIERVLLNLISNAIKYGNGKPIEVILTWDETHVRYEVVDHGIGIAPSQQRRLFSQFERVTGRSGTHQSHGLGLWIVRQLVTAHRGRVVLESRPGEGTRVKVTVPRWGVSAKRFGHLLRRTGVRHGRTRATPSAEVSSATGRPSGTHSLGEVARSTVGAPDHRPSSHRV